MVTQDTLIKSSINQNTYINNCKPTSCTKAVCWYFLLGVVLSVIIGLLCYFTGIYRVFTPSNANLFVTMICIGALALVGGILIEIFILWVVWLTKKERSSQLNTMDMQKNYQEMSLEDSLEEALQLCKQIDGLDKEIVNLQNKKSKLELLISQNQEERGKLLYSFYNSERNSQTQHNLSGKVHSATDDLKTYENKQKKCNDKIDKLANTKDSTIKLLKHNFDNLQTMFQNRQQEVDMTNLENKFNEIEKCMGSNL